MPFNGSGGYSLPAGNPVVTGTVIQSTWANTTLNDLATALSNVLVRDGQAAMTGDLNMGGKSITAALNITATAQVSVGNLVLTAATIPTNGIYLPAANTVGIATASTLRFSIDGNGLCVIASPTAAGSALTVNGIPNVLTFSNNTRIGLAIAGSASANDYNTIDFINSAGNITGRIGVQSAAGGSTIQFGTSNVFASGITSGNFFMDQNGKVTIGAPIAGTASLQLLNIANADALNVNSSNGGAGQSFGIFVRAGSTTADYAVRVMDKTQTNDYFKIRGDGAIQGRSVTSGSLVDMSPDTGTFTGTMTGMTTSPTILITFRRMGSIYVYTGAASTVSGTSNATTMTMTGIPAVAQVSTQQAVYCRVVDNGVTQLGIALLGGASVTFGLGSATSGGFTAAGTKGLPVGWTVVATL